LKWHLDFWKISVPLVIWDVVDKYQWFAGLHCPHLQKLSVLQISTAGSFDHLVHVYQITQPVVFNWTEQNVPDNSESYRPFQNCGSLVWKVLHIIVLVPVDPCSKHDA